MKAFSTSLLTLTLLLSLTGCAHRSEIVSQADATPSDVEVDLTQYNGLSNASAKQQWWTMFNDAQLNALVNDALRYNNNLQLALSRVKASQINLGLLESNDALKLDLHGGYDRQAISANSPLALLGAPSSGFSLWDTGLAASWELDLWGYEEKLQEAASETINAQMYATDVVRISLSAEIVDAYLELQNTLFMQDVATERVNLLAEELIYTESRRRNGAAAQTAVDSVRAALLSSKSILPTLVQQERTLRNRLAYLTGKVPGELHIELNSDPINVPEQVNIGIPSEAVHHRPDILAAEARLRAAISTIDAAEANFYPRVSLDGSFGFQAFTLPEAATWNSRNFMIGPAFHLPIFDGGALQKNLELTEVRQQQAAISYRDTVLRAWHEVDNALSAYKQSKLRRETQSEALDSWDQVVNSALNQLSQGAASRLQVVEANLARLNAKQRYLMDDTQFKLNVVALQRAVTRSWLEAPSGEQSEHLAMQDTINE
ncbi:efflux transporter outer membrane subunit [Alteromonas confluentis]|uniref:RND transporter n=1 Tax=Alteromonas confluentis TaxID=1656094 RepID=A0A1E7ZFW1_9ALTE|nr:efflux transporter outer membrane subunit [Alteromonas confluentis]OFC72415.1 hypothetical protein BFC18_02290 [Alteromonas confluentis]